MGLDEVQHDVTGCDFTGSCCVFTHFSPGAYPVGDRGKPDATFHLGRLRPGRILVRAPIQVNFNSLVSSGLCGGFSHRADFHWALVIDGDMVPNFQQSPAFLFPRAGTC